MDASFNLNANQVFTDEKKQYSISKLQSMQRDVRFCIGILSTHCVYFASRWSSELLISINKQIQSQKQQSNDNNDGRDDEKSSNNNNNNQANKKFSSYKSSIDQLSDECMLAKTYFDLKDYHRVVETLKNEQDINNNNYAFFLSSYASYLVGEKRKEEEILESNNQLEKSQIVNEKLQELMDNINKREKEIKNNELDGFHYYIKGIILRELNRDKESIESLIKSVNIFPYNWSAWRSLSELVINEKIFIYVKNKLKKHWICDIFIAEVMVETTEFYNMNEIMVFFSNLNAKLSEVFYPCTQCIFF